MIEKLLKSALILAAILVWIGFIGSLWMMTGFTLGFVGLFYVAAMFLAPIGIIYGCLYRPI